MTQELVDLIVDAARELAEQEAVERDGELDADTALFGEGGLLDSMGLVSLVIAVEQAIEERYDLSIGLADEKALSQKNSPYRTVRTLADYAAGEIAGQGAS